MIIDILKIRPVFKTIRSKFTFLVLYFFGDVSRGFSFEEYPEIVCRGNLRIKMAKVLFIVNVDWFFISHRLPIAIELIKLYKKAIALVFPSLYEGFGLPILEAMYFGLPVITSNKTSTVEVSGCSTLLCNPNDVESIAQAMERVMIDNHLRADLIEKGKIREREFSWGRTSREMLDLYDYISKKKE